MKKAKTIRYIGIDPGTNVLGYAVIDVLKNKISIVEMGTVRMSAQSTPSEKLKKIFESIQTIIKKTNPAEMAIEAPFYGKNVQSMLKLGRAQGVAMAASMVNKVEVTDYAPRKIKQSVTGNGNASKEQVMAMLETLTNTKLGEQELDATDALACAVCHHFQQSNVLKGLSKSKGWEGFIKNNPDRIL